MVLEELKYSIINGYGGYNYHEGLENIKLMCIMLILGENGLEKHTILVITCNCRQCTTYNALQYEKNWMTSASLMKRSKFSSNKMHFKGPEMFTMTEN